jgi:hypothetical protein
LEAFLQRGFTPFFCFSDFQLYSLVNRGLRIFFVGDNNFDFIFKYFEFINDKKKLEKASRDGKARFGCYFKMFRCVNKKIFFQASLK